MEQAEPVAGRIRMFTQKQGFVHSACRFSYINLKVIQAELKDQRGLEKEKLSWAQEESCTSLFYGKESDTCLFYGKESDTCLFHGKEKKRSDTCLFYGKEEKVIHGCFREKKRK